MTKWIAVTLWVLLPWTAGCGVGGGVSLFNLPSSSLSGSGEDFTVLLASFSGAEHVQSANRCRKDTEDLTHWRGVYVVHEDNTSNVYWGRYSTIEDARKDMLVARQWTSRDGGHPFEVATIMTRPGDNPGRPEHDLRNATGYYTLVIAHFYNDEERGVRNRKQYAIENCEDLRAKGVEAYYLHGPRISMVTVGSFPRSAYITVEKDGVARAVANSPALRDTWDKYPYLAVNGYQELVSQSDRATGKMMKVPTASYVYTIPSRTASVDVPNRSGDEKPGQAP